MKLKLFGKDVFEFRGKGLEYTLNEVSSTLEKSKFLPDFYAMNDGGIPSAVSEWVVMPDTQSSVGGVVAVPIKKEIKKSKKITLTPKGVHELKLLHDEFFQMKTDGKYIDQQLQDFKDKLGMIKSEEYDMRRGANEISSVVIRLENRKKYSEHKDLFEKFPYTTTTKISEIVKTHDNLKVGQIAQFIADMPKEAVDVMKEYNEATNKVCGKQAVFYIIADKKDFQQTNKRRDPILLAQSPFGHFWQILGAWDEEMLFLEEL
jgi:hypothetical protein